MVEVVIEEEQRALLWRDACHWLSAFTEEESVPTLEWLGAPLNDLTFRVEVEKSGHKAVARGSSVAPVVMRIAWVGREVSVFMVVAC